jgi:hypothetical protein
MGVAPENNMVQEVKALRLCMEQFRRQLSQLASQVAKMQQESYFAKSLLLDTVDAVDSLATVDSNVQSKSKSNPCRGTNPFHKCGIRDATQERPPWDSSPIPCPLSPPGAKRWVVSSHPAVNRQLQAAKLRQKKGRVIVS